jgi:hypothetical protein
MSARQLHFE